MLMRPLLAFRKQELHMICKALRVPYVEDHTNSDPTLTPRNAIRQLLRDPSQLPQALRHQAVIDRLIRLAAQRARQTSICARLLEACEPKRLDLRTGILKIRLPGTFKELKQLAKLDTQISSSEDDNLARQLIMACTTFIRPAWAIRSPRSSDLLPDLFPDLNGTRNDQRRSSFSAYELIWKQQKDVNNHKTSTVMPSLQADPVYIVRRSNPSRQNRQRRAIAIALSDRFRRAGTGRADQKGEENREGWLWTRWFLFDGTWWIRLKLDPRRTSSAFNLRYFEPEDGRRDEKLQRQLDEVAPADARYTLPAIVYDGKVVALPTIERSSPQAEGLGIRWEVRYANFPSGPKDLAMRRFQVLRDMFLEGTGERSTLGSVVDSEI